jgi:hypothetical protein
MISSRSKLTIIRLSWVAALLLAIAVVPLSVKLSAAKRATVGSGSAEHLPAGESQVLHGPNARVRASSTNEPSEGSPMRNLSPRLRAIIRDLETRASFMDSPFGFTNEEQREAMKNCQGVVDDLSADEVETLIRFYRDPESRKLPLMGNELVGALLYEHWGRVGGEVAVRTIETWIGGHVSESGGIVDLTDPFQMNPDFYEVAKVFSGWAAVDEQGSERALGEMLNELRKTGVPVTDFEASIRHRISEFAMQASEKTGGQQDGTEQPATRSESDLEGGNKPQPELEERSR